MAPAASTLAAAAASSNKRPPASDADSSSSALPPQGGGEDEAARSKSPKQQRLECPRCRSTNTKFCYYNNYSTAQPRHLCRACRRYWTHGGTLRDVPVGGATRRAKRRRAVSADAEPASSSAPAVDPLDACLPDLSTAFPFLSDGSYLPQPQFDPGLFAPATTAAFSWPSPVLPEDFYDGFAPAWDNGTTVGALGDVPPPSSSPGHRRAINQSWHASFSSAALSDQSSGIS